MQRNERTYTQTVRLITKGRVRSGECVCLGLDEHHLCRTWLWSMLWQLYSMELGRLQRERGIEREREGGWERGREREGEGGRVGWKERNVGMERCVV